MNEHYQGKDLGAIGNTAILQKVSYTEGPFPGGRRAIEFQRNKNAYVSIPPIPAMTFNSSFTFLIYTSPTEKTGSILEYYIGSHAYGLQMWFTTTWNTLQATLVYRKHVRSVIDVKQNDWYFLGFSYNLTTGTLSLWKDGEMIANQTALWTDLVFITNGTLYLGYRKKMNLYWRGGRVACLMVYATDLSRDQVTRARQQCRDAFYGEFYRLIFNYSILYEWMFIHCVHFQCISNNDYH